MYDELRRGFETAYINGSVVSNATYKPQFVSNNHKDGKKVLSSIEDELLLCDRFQISVAFITMSGITPLLQTLKELEGRGIPGEILTTNYLTFSEPRALDKLNSLSNITLKMFDTEEADEGFHTKGYIFRKDEIYRIIIGSSNITSAALTSNREWNTKLISTKDGEIAQQIVKEFNELWNSKYSIAYEEFMLNVSGVGSAKYEKYGERFIEAISRFKEENPDSITSINENDVDEVSFDTETHTRKKEIPVGAGSSWTEEEDKQLDEEYNSGMKISAIARKHDRTVGAIRSRLKKHGLSY